MGLSEQLRLIKACLELNAHRIINDASEEIKKKIDKDLVYGSKKASDDIITTSLTKQYVDDSEKINRLKEDLKKRLRNLNLEGMDRS